MKLTQELNQAATTLQDLLKSTQEELTKEKETVKSLQEQIQGKVLYISNTIILLKVRC